MHQIPNLVQWGPKNGTFSFRKIPGIVPEETRRQDTLTAVIGKWAFSVSNLILPLKMH